MINIRIVRVDNFIYALINEFPYLNNHTVSITKL